jgi:ribonuclease P/MRP protein subunit POP3
LGHHRRKYIHPSKGKKKNSKKRKRDGSNNKEDSGTTKPATATGKESAPDKTWSAPTPPIPEISRYLDIGLTCVTRTLQQLSPLEAAPPFDEEEPNSNNDNIDGDINTSTPKREAEERNHGQHFGPSSGCYAAIFIARSGQSKPFQAHFPQIVAAASKNQRGASEGQNPIRLVGFSKQGVTERLSAALGIPRVSVVGLRVGAPNAKTLVDFVEERVAPVVVRWMEETDYEFRETQIKAIETSRGVPRPRRGQ